MPPGISPATTGASAYQVTGSAGVVATCSLNVNLSRPMEIQLSQPGGAAGARVQLVRGMTSLELLPGATTHLSDDGLTFPQRRIDADATLDASGALTGLTCQILAKQAPATEVWELRIACAEVADHLLTTTGAVQRIMCDPVAGFSVGATPGFAPGRTVEQAIVAIAVVPATTTTPPNLVGAPAPPIHYRLSYPEGLAIAGFPLCGAAPPGVGPQLSFVTPAVAAEEAITLTLDVFFEGACPSTFGWLRTTATGQRLVIEPRPTVTPGVHSTVGVDTWIRT